MSGALLWPIAGAAGAGLARATAAAVNGGLSFAAELAQGLSGAGATADAEAQAADDGRREALQRRVEQLAQRIKQELEAASIDLSEPLTLTGDGLGGISAGVHPQRTEIENLLESDVLLLRDFERLADEFEAVAAEASGPDALPGFSVTVTK